MSKELENILLILLGVTILFAPCFIAVVLWDIQWFAGSILWIWFWQVFNIVYNKDKGK